MHVLLLCCLLSRFKGQLNFPSIADEEMNIVGIIIIS